MSVTLALVIAGAFYFGTPKNITEVAPSVGGVSQDPSKAEIKPASQVVAAVPEEGVEIVRESRVAAPMEGVVAAENAPWGPLSAAESTQFSNRLQRLMDDYADRPRKLGAQFIGLANRGNSIDVHLILAFVGTPSGDIPALEALGYVKNINARAELSALLKEKMESGKMNVAMAAVKSFARIQGDDAISDVERFISRGWQSASGYEVELCAAGVSALGEIRTPAGVVAVISQLHDAERPAWLLDFGSCVVATLDQMGQRSPGQTTPDSIHERSEIPRELIHQALLNYAAVLRKKMPGPSNKPGQVYYEQKIQEAERAAQRVLLAAPSSDPL